MSDVIRAALDAHQLTLSTGRADPTRGNCSTWATCTGCGWTMNVPATQAMTAHITHQAEVATTAALDAVEQVHAEHRYEASETPRCSGCVCGWDDDGEHGTHPEHLTGLLAAALAGEG